MQGVAIAFHTACQFALLFAGLSLWRVVKTIEDYYGSLTRNAIAYNLMFGFDSRSGADRATMASVRKRCLVRPLRWSAVATFAVQAAWFGFGHYAVAPLSPALPTYAVIAALVAEIAYLLFMRTSLGRELWDSRRREPNCLDALYVDPRDVAITSVRRRSLVLIYVESLQAEYRRQDVFHRNLLQPIDALGGVSVERFTQLPCASQSTAAAVATTFGLPFIPTRAAQLTYNCSTARRFGHLRFLPNAVALGDILRANGYVNLHLSGAAANFHGLDAVFHDHGFASRGFEALVAETRPRAVSGWGLYDDDLLDVSLRRLEVLARGLAPFCLVLHLVDTHGPFGGFSPRMNERFGGRRDYVDLIAYTATIVAEFVSSASAKGFLDDACVAIIGDHLPQRTPISERLQTSVERTIYNRFLCKDDISFNRDEINHFDLLPTLLEMIGFTVDGGQLGLGVSALGPPDKAREAIWRSRTDAMRRTALNPSKVYDRLWRAPSPQLSGHI